MFCIWLKYNREIQNWKYKTYFDIPKPCLFYFYINTYLHLFHTHTPILNIFLVLVVARYSCYCGSHSLALELCLCDPSLLPPMLVGFNVILNFNLIIFKTTGSMLFHLFPRCVQYCSGRSLVDLCHAHVSAGLCAGLCAGWHSEVILWL